MQDILERIGQEEGAPGLLIIAALAAMEYLFPPFPGDAVSLAAIFLVVARGWSPVLVLASLTTGSIAGGLCQYLAGAWLARRGWQPRSLRGQQILRGIQSAAARFRRHGAVYLAINRFLPGLRSVFWLAAGYVRMRPASAVLWGGLSAFVWSSILLALGWVAGDNREWLEQTIRTYSAAAWGVLGAAGLFLFARWLYRRRRLDTPGGGG
ncbi:MAG: DedA family protein [Deltaproteobacteria bacterium]|nr:DedA family protein [Deltaproteobacteria bacterium]